MAERSNGRTVRRSHNYRRRPCPRCGQRAYRLRTTQRTLHDLGDPMPGRPRQLVVTYSQHHCSACGHYFNADLLDLAPPNAHYTYRVMRTAVRLVVEDGLPYRTASWHLRRDHPVCVPFATVQNWVEAGGEKGPKSMSLVNTLTTCWRTSPATSPPMNCTMVPIGPVDRRHHPSASSRISVTMLCNVTTVSLFLHISSRLTPWPLFPARAR